MNESEDLSVRLLHPQEVQFYRSVNSVLQGIIGKKTYNELIVYQTFPFRYPGKYISIRNVNGGEIGIVRDIRELDDRSKSELELELRLKYFLPLVKKIISIKQKVDLWIWHVDTHIGPMRMVMRNLHEHLLYPGDGRIVLVDMTGRRCEISDWRLLDTHSRKQLKDII